MPIIRKLIRIGRSRAITLPKGWLDYYEQQEGKKVEAVAIEVNRKLTIEPLLVEVKTKSDEK